jgi:hypothetical protein
MHASCVPLPLPLIHTPHREVDMPDDAFTDGASAKIEDRKLTIRIARRDPQGPAMEVGDSLCWGVLQIICHSRHT